MGLPGTTYLTAVVWDFHPSKPEKLSSMQFMLGGVSYDGILNREAPSTLNKSHETKMSFLLAPTGGPSAIL